MTEGRSVSVVVYLKSTPFQQGLFFALRGGRHNQLEMSGDLTVVLSELEETPEWFHPEKIHRFDGPEGGVSLFSGSQPFVDIKARPRPRTDTTPQKQTESVQSQTEKNPSPHPNV